MWNRDDQQDEKTKASAATPDELEGEGKPGEEDVTTLKDKTRRFTKSGIKVTLHWMAQRRQGRAGKRKVARFKHTLSVTEAQAKELRRGRLAVVNDQLLEIERKELGGDPDSRTWTRTDG